MVRSYKKSKFLKKRRIIVKNKIFLAILLYMVIIGNVYAINNSKVLSNNSKVLSENGVTIPLVADRITDNGEEGIILNAQVIVKNGTGVE